MQENKAYEAENMFVLPVRDETPSPIQINQPPKVIGIRSPNFKGPSSESKKVETPRIIKKRTKVHSRCWFVQLPPEALAIVADQLGHRLPLFMFTNRVSFKQTLQGQLHVYELQRQSVLKQVYLFEQEARKPFQLTAQSRSELDSISADEWRKAVASVPLCKKKDSTILKLYFTCLSGAKQICCDVQNE